MGINVSPLLASAQEFIEESLRNLGGNKLSFAIVHAVTATELLLKERLARLNPALILKNIDTKTPDREQTVALGALPRRLANFGMPLSSSQARLIQDFAQWRHQIVHHMPTYDHEAARRQIPKLLDFLATFLRTELGTPLEEFLPRDLYREAGRLLSDWQHAVETARAAAVAEGNLAGDAVCPLCGGVEVVCLREENEAHCHLCGRGLYVLDECDGCGQMTVTSYMPSPGENYCDACVDAAGDRYISWYIDYIRGK